MSFPASLAECHSSDDLARYLHSLGWRAPLDRNWDKLQILWQEIQSLRPQKPRGKARPPIQDEIGEWK